MLMRIRILILLGFLSVHMNLHAQSLSNQVLVPVAGVSLSGNISYSQTIGESAVEIFSTPEIVLTQGFQQPSVKFVTGIIPEGTGVDVYPNPAINNIKVKLFGDSSRDFVIEVINITGKVVYSETQSFTENYFIERTIPVGSFFRGIYFVKIYSTDKLINRTFKIEKM
jgi:hypothetical protein